LVTPTELEIFWEEPRQQFLSKFELESKFFRRTFGQIETWTIYLLVMHAWSH
jgi:hypothetical protein